MLDPTGIGVYPAYATSGATRDRVPTIAFQLDTADGPVGFALDMGTAANLAMLLPEIIEKTWADHDAWEAQ